MQYMKELISHANQNGIDLPDNLKSFIKNSKIVGQLDVDSKLSLREKAIAKKRHDELSK